AGLVTGPPTGTVTVSIDGIQAGSPVDLATGTVSGLSVTLKIPVTSPPGTGANHVVLVSYTATGSFVSSQGDCMMTAVPIIAVSIPCNQPGATTTSSYQGGAADMSLAIANGWWATSMSGYLQAWYSVKLIGGKSYVISFATAGGADSFTS